MGMTAVRGVPAFSQSLLEDLDRETEEASYLLGATRWQTFYRVILPSLRPAIITGFALVGCS